VKNIFLSVLLASAMSVSIAKADVYQQLSSGDIAQIKRAAQTMYAGNENSRENADVLAEILVTKYKDNIDTEIDTLSWACKTLASTSDGRYRALLKKIADSDVHSKLRKYAKKSYRKLPKETNDPFQQGTVELNTLAEQEVTRVASKAKIIPKANLTATQRKLFAIAKGDLRSIKSLAQDIYERKAVDTEIGDALSEYLLLNYAKAPEFQADTLAWICRSFGKTDQGRYKQVMKVVYKGTNHHKIRSRARDAYLDLSDADDYYQKGQVDFDEIVNKFKA